MGIQINGQTDTVSSTTSGGKVTITPFNGNVGTGASISSPATNVLTLGTNNTESVRINSTGVGIGTNNPASTLDVGGEITIRRTAAGNEGGQINFARASDNAVAWNIDAYGSTSTPSLRFIDNTAAVVRMEIDGSGRVTMPSQPMFSARTYSSSGNTVQTSIIAFLWSTIDLNVGNSFNNTTGLFTAPVAGNYAVSFNFNRRASFNAWTGAYIVKNSTTIASSWFPPSSDSTYTYAPVTLNYIINLAANDTIAFCYHNSYSLPSTSNDGNFASIFLVG